MDEPKPAPVPLSESVEMDLRELKALELAARARIVFHLGRWLVPSQGSGKVYSVSLSPPACTCEDFALRNSQGGEPAPCKHVIAARLVAERDGGEPAPVVVDEDVPKRKTYKQDWPAYDRAQMTEKNRFLELLSDLCRGIEEPARTKTGRRPHLMRDMVFASAFKVFSTISSRRFACDLADAHDRGFITKLMHSVQVCQFIDSEAMTPVLTRLVQQSALPLRCVETTFAADSTGFSTSRFVRWYDEKYGVAARGLFEDAQAMLQNFVNERPFGAAAAIGFWPANSVGDDIELYTDESYLSKENLELVELHGGTPLIPFKSNSVPGEAGSTWERLYFYYQFRREEFLRRYHQRSNIESTWAMCKAKFRDHVRSKTDVAMKNEVLLKALCHNIVVVHQSAIELGIAAEFWTDEPKGSAVLKFPVTA